MPELDGISAAEQIIDIAPVLMLTAFSQRELVERARDAGAMAYVVKPFGINDLVPAIEIAISRHAQMRSLPRLHPNPHYHPYASRDSQDDAGDIEPS